LIFLKRKEKKMKDMIKKFFKEEEGTETVEWAIIIGLIAVAAIGVIMGIGAWVNGKFSALSASLSAS
jgi:pilus assembly protein Flp/PilA